jgi:hypothetical protein
VKLFAQELIHDEKLSNRVEQVDEFDKKVGGDQVVSKIDARSAEKRFAKVFYLLKHGVYRLTTSRVAGILVDILHNVFHYFFSA